MKQDLAPEIDSELNYFLNKFAMNGWNWEDSAMITKPVDFVVNPESRNEKYKQTIMLVLYPKILHYIENGKNKSVIWIAFRFRHATDKTTKYQEDSKLFRQVAEWLKQEVQSIGLKPFKDEDAYYGMFSRIPSDGREEIEFCFYLNRDYPNGYWHNHTL